MAESKENALAAVEEAAAAQDICTKIAGAVNEQLGAECKRKVNEMAPCFGEQPPFKCGPVKFPPFRPWMSIRWGDSRCDCIEGDDTEIMCLTICNPYSNVTLSNMVVQQLTVVDLNGSAVPTLPDGTPSIQLVPIGPYCFGDIAPCSCVSRQFILRLRGAVGNTQYQIRLDGVCFDVCMHLAARGCFTFFVCKD